MLAVVIFNKRGEGETPGVGSVVVGSIVIHGPVHELEVAVGAIGIEVKKVGHTHLAKTKFDAPLWQLREKRQRCARVDTTFVAQGNHLVPHQSRHVWRFADRWIPYHIDIGKTGQSEGFSDSMPTRLLHIA